MIRSRKKWLASIALGWVLFTGFSRADLAPSSEIPVRREFPLSDKVDPCQNFHDYVCTRVESSFRLRDDRSVHTFAFHDSRERLLEAKKSFFKNIEKEKDLPPRGDQLVNFYQACMNEAASAQEEKERVRNLLAEVNQIQNAQQFASLMVSNLRKGRYSVLSFGPHESVSDSSRYDVFVGAGFMSLPEQSYYENPELMAAYRRLVVDYFKTIGVAQPESRAEHVLRLEKEFAKAYPKPAERRQRFGENHEKSQEQVKKEYSRIGIEELLNLIPKKTRVTDPLPEGLVFYRHWLTEEHLSELKDFYLYRAGSMILDDGFPEYFKEKFEFNKSFLGGPNQRPERQERCTKSVMENFDMELDEILLPRLFPGFPEQKFTQLAERIRQTILKGVESNGWLTAQAKSRALKKIKVARLQLIRPRSEREWNFTPAMPYSKDKPIQNSETRAAAEFKKEMDDLREPVNQDRWSMGPLTVNAYYSRQSNKFVLPLGILQYPFYDKAGTDIENLAAAGSVIGHELGHGIDDIGSRFDELGRLKQWMTGKDLKGFKERSQKLVNQFNQAGLNGELTLGENSADLAGLSFAYDAAFPGGTGSLEEKKRFFVSYGRLWCGVIRPKMAERLMKTDPHSLGWARINEQIKHQPGFREAFACKAGDPMALPDAERVRIW